MKLPPDHWLPRFSAKLRELNPTVSAADVVGAALEAYKDADDLMVPEEAAEAYVSSSRSLSPDAQ
jgi:hypothetical protein